MADPAVDVNNPAVKQFLDAISNFAGAPTTQTQIGVPKGYVPNLPSQVSTNTPDAVGTPRASGLYFKPKVDQNGDVVNGPDGKPVMTQGYQEGDQYALANAGGPIISGVQKQLAAVGLLPKGKVFQNGVWDAATADAYKSLLGYANQLGISDTEALTRLQDGGGLSTVDANGNIVDIGGNAQPYQTNTENIKAAVKAIGPQLLGKEVPDEVVNHIVDTLHGAEDKAAQGQLGKETAPSADSAWYEEQLKELMPHTVKSFQTFEGLTSANLGAVNNLGANG